MTDCVAGSALPPPSHAHVDEVAAYLGVAFPPDYRALLVRCHGGVPARRCFDCSGRQRLIERWLPLLDSAATADANGWADVDVVASQLDARLATDPDSEHIDLVPIAALFAGDFVVLDYRKGRTMPSVGVWDHEASSDFAPVVQTVAPTLAAFLALLRAD